MRIKEYMTVPFEVKATDDGKRQFEGYSATWDLDLGNDIIHKGAFKRSIARFQRGEKHIPLIDSHNYGSIFNSLGHLIEAQEDDRGLLSKWQVIDGLDGERTMDRLRSGAIRKKSIGYQAIKTQKETVTREGKEIQARGLLEIAWEETSLVIFPMNESADVTAVKMAALAAALKDRRLSDEEKETLVALFDHKAVAAYGKGDMVEALVSHMEGMKGSVGEVAEVRNGPYYGVRFDGEQRIHKWLAQDELKAAAADARSGGMSDMKHTRALLDDPLAAPPVDCPASVAPAMKGLAPEQMDALRQRLLKLRLRSLVAR